MPFIIESAHSDSSSAISPNNAITSSRKQFHRITPLRPVVNKVMLLQAQSEKTLLLKTEQIQYDKWVITPRNIGNWQEKALSGTRAPGSERDDKRSVK